MNRAINQIQIESNIKVQPITILDTLNQSECNIPKESFWSKIAGLFSSNKDLTFEEWQRLESKPRISSSGYANHLYGGGFK